MPLRELPAMLLLCYKPESSIYHVYMSDCEKVCLLLWGNHAAQSHTTDALLGSKLAFLFLFWGGDTIFLTTSWLIFTLAFCPAVPGLDFFFFCLGMDIFGRRRPGSHPLCHHHSTSLSEVLFFDTFNTTNTIDLTYWCEGAWLLRGIWPQHIEHAVGWKERTHAAVQERKITTHTHAHTQNLKQKQQNRLISKWKQFKNVTLVTTNNRWH